MTPTRKLAIRLAAGAAGCIVVTCVVCSSKKIELPRVAPPPIAPAPAFTPALPENADSHSIPESGANPQALSPEMEKLLQTAGFNELLEILADRKAAAATQDEIIALLESIAATRPELAIELGQVLAGDKDEEKVEWVSAVARGWADRDPKRAWEWLNRRTQRLDQLANGALLEVIVAQIAASHPQQMIENADALLRLGTSHPRGIEPQDVIRIGLEAMINHGNIDLARSAVERWASNSQGPQIGADAFETIARGMAHHSDEEAAAWLQSLPSSENRDFALGAFGENWAAHDPDAAMRWAGELPADHGGLDAVQRTFDRWAERDSALAGQWLNNHREVLQPGKQTDMMIVGLINGSPIARSDPQGALQWVALISEPETRSGMIAGVIRKWARVDFNAASNYLQRSAGLTAQQKQNVWQAIHDPAVRNSEE